MLLSNGNLIDSGDLEGGHRHGLGGGAIGVEMAQIFQDFGAKVTVLEARDRILAEVEPEIAKHLTAVLNDDPRLSVHTSVQIEKISGTAGAVTVKTRDFVWIEELIDLVESEASSELYGLLKRPDEKHVTERAYDNPKFVEDMVRDVAARLNADERISAYVVESENFESIHNHSAYALIERNKESDPANNA